MGAFWVVFSSGFLFLFVIHCSSAAEVKTIDVKETKELLKSGHVYIDVRTEKEYQNGHVVAEKIVNVPYLFFTQEGKLTNPKFLEMVRSKCTEDDLLVVGCQSGVRSLSAAADLLRAGFKHVNNMGGGYVAWVENGFAIERQKDDEL